MVFGTLNHFIDIIVQWASLWSSCWCIPALEEGVCYWFVSCSWGKFVLMMMSMTAAHVSHAVVKLRYDFSHIMSIASFRQLMLRRFSHPFSIGFCSVLGAILREESSFHMKDVRNLVRAFLTWSSIPCTWVRN